MRMSINRKIFWLFSPLTIITLLFGVTTYYGLTGIHRANSQTSLLKDFQLQLKELDLRQAEFIRHQSGQYHDRDDSKLTELKKIKEKVVEFSDTPEIEVLLNQLIANLETNFLHHINNEAQEDFFRKTSERLFKFSTDTLVAIEKKHRTAKRGFVLAMATIILLSITLTLFYWRYSSLYFRRFLSNHRNAIKAIESGDVHFGNVHFELSSLPDDEIGDLTRTLRQVISDQKQAEEKLRQSENRFRRLVETAADAIFMFNERGEFEVVNSRACKNLGYTEDELLQLTVADIDAQLTQKHVEAITKKTPFNEWPLTMESRHMRKDGSTFPVEVRVDAMETEGGRNFVALARDISEKKQAEDDRTRLSAAIEHSSETVVITDLSGTIQYVNPAFEKLTGYSRDEVIGQNPRILSSGKHDKLFFKEMWTTLLQGKSWKGHFINKKKNGLFFEEEVTLSPVKNSDDYITNFVAVKRDVTREVALEQQLQQAMKMEAIGTLAGGIAHDFNNILGAILGYTEMARDDSPAGSTVVEDLNRVLKAVDRAKHLVEQILAFSRQTDTEYFPFQPARIVKETITMLRSSLPTTIDIEENISLTSGLIFADPTQLQQIVMNLCINAFHAMEETGGSLKISLQEKHIGDIDLHSDPDSIPGTSPETYVQLSIADTGPGIAPEIRGRIFDPFFTTKKTGKGTGMGLSIIHGIVKSSGGFISLHSVLGEGTVFHVFLPVINSEELPEYEATYQNLRGSERVLFIDDEEMLATMGRDMLTNLGYQVTVRTSSLAALEIFRIRPDEFDVVITDQTMPDMTGADMAAKMLEIRPDIPIILCTGYSTIITEEEAKTIGIKEFALKPLAKKDIAALIRKVLDS